MVGLLAVLGGRGRPAVALERDQFVDRMIAPGVLGDLRLGSTSTSTSASTSPAIAPALSGGTLTWTTSPPTSSSIPSISPLGAKLTRPDRPAQGLPPAVPVLRLPTHRRSSFCVPAGDGLARHNPMPSRPGPNPACCRTPDSPAKANAIPRMGGIHN
ncbi:hypothetical protein [Aquisphaera giovannonii]|uniref:hypothetical protein n=1 Tax=Aquisphaera giovannonii TaxID=406548 RepID=UPI0011DF84B7|nr:hypothetical protein [Aquisphaera giovannonii]